MMKCVVIVKIRPNVPLILGFVSQDAVLDILDRRAKKVFSLLSYTYSLVREDSMYIYVSIEIKAVLVLFEIEKEIDGVV